MQVCTAGAVRAEQVLHCDKRSVPFDTTSGRVSGDALPSEDPQGQQVAAPVTMTHGESKAKRPDLKPCVCSPLGVARAVPLWGKPHDGHASDTTGNPTLWADSAACLAQHGVAPGASLSVADAALVTEANLAARGDTLFRTR